MITSYPVPSRAYRCVASLLLVCAVNLTANTDRPASPFAVSADLDTVDGAHLMRFQFQVPEEHVLYADRLKFETEDGEALAPANIPAPVVAIDKVTGREKRMYQRGFAAAVKLLTPLPATIVLKFQGCSNSACYFPEKHLFRASAEGTVARVEPAAEPDEDEPAPTAVAAAATPVAGDDPLTAFTVAGRETGYLNPKDFIGFLDKAQSGQATPSDPLVRLRNLGLAATLLFILIGGLGLNLTPCVLPMIPINLAIIGAGSRASSRGRGFTLGAIYGSGMALAYGGLGLFVVLTGSKFGALNSSVWFNAGIALVFVVMALAMFDLINVDFSRFQGSVGPVGGKTQSQSVMAFGLGAVAAMLAGACVAPVVISVLLLSTQMYGQGMVVGLSLPFLLGLGMALPWPFAGAGLSFLPKPGKWMKRIKQGFGVLILLFACYYGHLAYNLFDARQQTTLLASARSSGSPDAMPTGNPIDAALQKARAERRPVFIDFAASWCKNCVAMDETVFSKAEVRTRLNDFVVVRYDAEQPNASPARQVLDRFGVMGLPTYVVLTPK